MARHESGDAVGDQMTRQEATLLLFSQLATRHQRYVSERVMIECRKRYPDVELAAQIHSDTFARLLGVTPKAKQRDDLPHFLLSAADQETHDDPQRDGRVKFIVGEALRILKFRRQRIEDASRARWGRRIHASQVGSSCVGFRWVQPQALAGAHDRSVVSESDRSSSEAEIVTRATASSQEDYQAEVDRSLHLRDVNKIAQALIHLVRSGVIPVDDRARAVLEVLTTHPELWDAIDASSAGRFPNAQFACVLREGRHLGDWDDDGKEVANARSRLALAVRKYGRTMTGSDDLTDLYAVLVREGHREPGPPPSLVARSHGME